MNQKYIGLPARRWSGIGCWCLSCAWSLQWGGLVLLSHTCWYKCIYISMFGRTRTFISLTPRRICPCRQRSTGWTCVAKTDKRTREITRKAFQWRMRFLIDFRLSKGALTVVYVKPSINEWECFIEGSVSSLFLLSTVKCPWLFWDLVAFWYSRIDVGSDLVGFLSIDIYA